MNSSIPPSGLVGTGTAGVGVDDGRLRACGRMVEPREVRLQPALPLAEFGYRGLEDLELSSPTFLVGPDPLARGRLCVRSLR